MGRPAPAEWTVPGTGFGPGGPASPGGSVCSSLASARPLDPGAGLHLLPSWGTSSSPGCHLSSDASLGQFSPIPPSGFGGFLLRNGLEGHPLDGQRSPRGRRGSSSDCAEPPAAGECREPGVHAGKGRGPDGGPGVPAGHASHHLDLFYSSPHTLPLRNTATNLALKGSS